MPSRAPHFDHIMRCMEAGFILTKLKTHVHKHRCTKMPLLLYAGEAISRPMLFSKTNIN